MGKKNIEQVKTTHLGYELPSNVMFTSDEAQSTLKLPIIALFFTHLNVPHPFIMLSVVLLSSIVFSLAGFINAVFARNFDDISIIPTFVLTPLTYLGGVFYSISLLPPFWQTVSLANPVLHMVNAFRYGILGVSDIRIGVAIGFMLVATALLYGVCIRLLVSGRGMRQ